MAWLYAVPYEQFLDPADAIYANAWTLAFVSAWRVLLISRVLSVIWSARYWKVLCLVLLFADVAVFIGTRLSPAPMVDFMGGFQHTPEEEALAELNLTALMWSVLLAPVLLIAALVAWVKFKGTWSVEGPRERVAPTVWALPAVAFLALAPALWLMQPEQRLRHRVEQSLRAGRIEDGLREMSAHERHEFPRVWDPPPRLAFEDRSPTMDDIRAALAAGGQASWVRALYLEKSLRLIMREHYGVPWVTSLAELLEYERTHTTPGQIDHLRFHLEHDERLTSDQRDALRRCIERLEQPPPK
jgi:hypothetical protein